ncbi:MAG: methyltransferase [Rhizobiales bacterium]|nr:methyltransferase [Hyphomicrobiales bacterium]
MNDLISLPERVRQSFGRSLSDYHQSAFVQAEIAERLAHLLNAHRKEPAGFGCVFEFGCSTGFLTRHLVRNFAIGHYVANDLVAGSAPLIASILAETETNWRFIAGPVQDNIPDGPFDLVAAASTVQWIADLPPLLQRLSDALAPGGMLALSGFGRQHFHELTAMGSTAGAVSYKDRSEWRDLLPSTLDLVAIEQAERVVHFPTVRALLVHLRRTGVNAGAGTPWSRSAYAAFEAEYRDRFSDAQGVRLTYDPVLLIARRKN